MLIAFESPRTYAEDGQLTVGFNLLSYDRFIIAESENKTFKLSVRRDNPDTFFELKEYESKEKARAEWEQIIVAMERGDKVYRIQHDTHDGDENEIENVLKDTKGV